MYLTGLISPPPKPDLRPATVRIYIHFTDYLSKIGETLHPFFESGRPGWQNP
jgi:hypothetical protein